MKVTGWFKGHQKPVRVGVYQRKYGLKIWYCYWNGENFCSGCANAQAAALYKTQASTLQNSVWRGITNGVKA